jgi:hypothetical protein
MRVRANLAWYRIMQALFRRRMIQHLRLSFEKFQHLLNDYKYFKGGIIAHFSCKCTKLMVNA